MARIDKDLLAAYMERFVGFGSYDADLWFAGMEPGGDPVWSGKPLFGRVLLDE